MNTEDQFEQRLRNAPQRQIPPSWREEILHAAWSATPPRVPAQNDRLGWRARLCLRLGALVWPHPAAWGGLAAAWLVVLGLNLSAHEPGSHASARKLPPISGEMRKLLLEQERLFVELAGPREPVEADRPKAAIPSPQSRWRPDCAFT
jgi:hypothetical protein